MREIWLVVGTKTKNLSDIAQGPRFFMASSGLRIPRIWQSDDVYEKCDDISIVNGFLEEGTETEETAMGLGYSR